MMANVWLDETATGELLSNRMTLRWLRRIATRIAGPALAEDVLQQALLELLAYFEHRSVNVENPLGYFAATVRHTALRELTRRSKFDALRPSPAATTPIDESHVLLRMAIDDCIDELPSRYYTTLVMREVLGYETAEIARLLNRNIGGIRRSLKAAYAYLAECLETKGVYG